MPRSSPGSHAVKKPWFIPKVPQGGEDKDLTDLRLWVRDMVDWGKRVRRDILDLEKNVDALKGTMTPAGDPGDPPPEPE